MNLLYNRRNLFLITVIITILILDSSSSRERSSFKDFNQNGLVSNTQTENTPNTLSEDANANGIIVSSPITAIKSITCDVVQNKSSDSTTTDIDRKEIISSSTDSDKDNIDSINEKRMIAIDAGHQRKGNYGKEPIGPGSKTKKAKVSSGTQGISSRVPEYQLNLTIALKVKEELLDRGYAVFMIRETNNVDISNKERADLASESGSDLFIRIHANGSESSKVKGVSTLFPSEDNPYVSYLSNSSYKLSQSIVDAICAQTGAKNRGASANDTMSGINWSTLPVAIIEMGFMSNPKEDKAMQTKSYQTKIVNGICDGIDDYYENQNE